MSLGNIKVVIGKSGGLMSSSTPVTLKNSAIGLEGGTVGSITRLDGLDDVVEGTPATGSTLVYDSGTDKYIVKQLDLDGGSF
jgi:hypothetical protein